MRSELEEYSNEVVEPALKGVAPDIPENVRGQIEHKWILLAQVSSQLKLLEPGS